MITFEQALKANEFWHVSQKNADGTPVRCRRNGRTKTWKTRPGQFNVPVKHGLKNCFNLTNGWPFPAAKERRSDQLLRQAIHLLQQAIKLGGAS